MAVQHYSEEVIAPRSRFPLNFHFEDKAILDKLQIAI
jgi:hypothetical protein